MVLFRRAKSSQPASTSPGEAPKKEKGSWKRPASASLLTSLTFLLLTHQIDTAFKQQRLKAWQPILTPKTVLPTLLIIGILFAPIGALLVIGSNKVRLPTAVLLSCFMMPPQHRSPKLRLITLGVIN
jgi:hypothetical protein